MEESPHTYLAIDLKSFYASVECVARGLDPLTTNLVVADVSRTEKTICLAVSPALKKYGIKGRPRLFEVVEAVRKINLERRKANGYRPFHGKSCFEKELEADPGLELDYIAATPRMATYIQTSARIYSIYLRHIAKEDIHVYSIDECFFDVTKYLKPLNMTPTELCRLLIKEVYDATGITATGGIGPNLYLAKVAMDIVAKHMEPDAMGARVAELSVLEYRKQLWDHRPLTDFWRVGKGTEKRLNQEGILTMGDLARASLEKEELLYRLFGVNAEYLIDHAWGVEPCTMAAIKSYKPENNSLGQGQVLSRPYEQAEARTVILEMAEALSLDLVKKGLVAGGIGIGIGYDSSDLKDSSYQGEIKEDYYGRSVPKPTHGSIRFAKPTSAEGQFEKAVGALFDHLYEEGLKVRRLNVAAFEVTGKEKSKRAVHQFSLFEDPDEVIREEEKQQRAEQKDKQVEEAILSIQSKFGKNAVLKGRDLEEGATARERNSQIGGHKA